MLGNPNTIRLVWPLLFRHTTYKYSDSKTILLFRLVWPKKSHHLSILTSPQRVSFQKRCQLPWGPTCRGAYPRSALRSIVVHPSQRILIRNPPQRTSTLTIKVNFNLSRQIWNFCYTKQVAIVGESRPLTPTDWYKRNSSKAQTWAKRHTKICKSN